MLLLLHKSEVGCICTRARAHPVSISRERLSGSRSNSVVGRDPLPTCFAQVRRGEHLHVRTCTPRFHISETTWRIALKFGMWLGTHYLRVLYGSGRGASARAHVHTRFPYLGNGLADCVKHWCVARAPLPSCFTQIRGSVNLHVRTCTPHCHISGTAGQIALNRRLGDRERRSETTLQIALKFCFELGTNYHLCHLGCVKNCQKRSTSPPLI